MWIFGYGSLVWKPDFPYVKKVIGYVKGYERRFWQACSVHRGVPGKPGRVVTLIPSTNPDEKAWGVCYEADNSSPEIVAFLKHLDEREKMFEKIAVKFYPVLDITNDETNGTRPNIAEAEQNTNPDENSFDCTAYIASQTGPLYLGDASAEEIAIQISTSAGSVGPNSEYLFMLAQFMREYLPHVNDSHLFDIEHELISLTTNPSSSVD